MNIIVSGKNIDLTDAIHRYAEDKTRRLEKYLEGIEPIEVKIELHTSGESKGAPRSTVEITLSMPDTLIRCEETAPDMYEAIDIAQERIENKIRRWKEREIDKVRHVDKKSIVSVGHVDIHELKNIIKRKKVNLGIAVSEDDAIDRMELLGHDFYFFINSNTGLPNIVYRREDGGYGLLQSE